MLLKSGLNLPNVLIIGSQKCASTWLRDMISQHPDVYAVRPEIHFFDHDSNFSKGIHWYAGFFSSAGTQKVLCEKTPDYIWNNSANFVNEPNDKPARIYGLIPDAKLIVVLRDPVDRALSAWGHLKKTGKIPLSMDINSIFNSGIYSVAEQYGVLSRGMYHKQLQDFLQFFPRNQLKIIYQERDVHDYPRDTLKEVCKFVGIDQNFDFEGLDKKANENVTTLLGAKFISSSSKTVRFISRQVDKRVFQHTPMKKIPKAYFEPEVLRQVEEFYLDDTTKLDQSFGPVPDSWFIRQHFEAPEETRW